MKLYAYLTAIILALSVATFLFVPFVRAQGISQLQQFTSTTSPASAITQTTYGKAFRLTGQSTGCAQFSSNGTLTSTGGSCGGGFSYPFPSNATTTLLTFSGGLLSTASTTIGGGTAVTGLTVSGSATTTGDLFVQGTGTSTFAGSINMTGTGSHLTVHGIRSDASDGLHVHANNWLDVANFGAGNTANATFYGAVNIDGNTRIATSITGPLQAIAGAVTASSSLSDAFIADNITAGQLAANGTNCSAGNYPLGVDASGNVEDCTAASGSSFSYPFPSNATTTLLAFNGGLTSASTTLTGPFVFNNATGTNATTTSLAVSNLTSALVLAGTAGSLGEYAGIDCNNQFVRDVSAAGAGTCATVTNNDLANSSITLNGLAISLGNTGTITAASSTLLANVNTWLGLQTFNAGFIANAASSTIVGNFNVASTTGGVLYDTSVPGYFTKTFSYGSSTQGQGTTTRSIGVATQALTVKNVQCDFSNFMRVLLYDGTNRANDFIASSTIGTFSYTTNNSFTAGEAMRIDIGTTTNIAANVYGSCTFKYVYD